MKPKEKSITAIVLWFFLAFPAWAVEGKVRLTFPVRVWEGKQPLTELRKEDLRLTIDNRQWEILELVKQTASIGQRPEFLGRNFILSFQVAEYGAQVQEAVSYFITEILNTEDSLILFTPVGIYKFNVSANKVNMIREIANLVEKDCTESRKKFDAAEKNLEIQMNRIMQLSLEIDTDPGLVDTFKTIGAFLSSFPQEFLNFRNRHLFPNPDKYRQVLDFLGNREGQRWWIQFQQGDIFGVVSKAHVAVKKIDSYCNLYEHVGFAFQNHLKLMEKHLQLVDSFPGAQLLDTFTNANTRYDVLIWDRHQRSENTPDSDAAAQLEPILNQLALDTGGKSIYTANLEQGMKNLRDHQDHYYELAYDFDGKPGEKKIDLTAPAVKDKNLRLSYKDRYTAEEMQSLVRYLTRERVQIKDFSLNKNLVKFSIKSIALDEKKTFGLVKARIQLFGLGGEHRYRTENTLRSSRQDVAISIPIPAQHKGRFKLVITVFDLFANRLAALDKEVILE